MWNWLFGKRKGEPALLLVSKSSGTGVTPVSSLHRVEEFLETSEGCCPCCPGIEDCDHIKRRNEPPRLGLDRRGRPVTPHTCDLEPTPSSSSYNTIPYRRPTVKNHKCERGSSSTDPNGPQFEQFKSPTTPKYRPSVTPHSCFDDDDNDNDDDGVNAHKSPSKPGKGSKQGGKARGRGGGGGDKNRHFWKWFVLALLLLGVAGAAAGTAAGPKLLGVLGLMTGGKKKCLQRPEYC